MAQEKYGFFNSTAEDERSYDSADMAAALRTLASSGVAAADTCLQVTAEGSTMRTLVGYGTAMIEGYYYQLRDDGSGIQAFTHTTETELDRIDRIVLRLDFTARKISLIKRIGVAASTPEAPALMRSADACELSLARVLVQAGAAEILPADITDERGDDDVCGLIAPESLRRSAIEQMIGDAVDDATDDVLRYSGQALETAEQAQARANIAAMRSIGASTAIQKGNGSGDTEDAVPGTDFALPASEAAVTLAAASWSGAAAPFTQTVAVPGITADQKAVVGLAHSAASAQYLAAAEAMLHATAQGAGSITITAEGKAPAIDLPILVQIVG